MGLQDLVVEKTPEEMLEQELTLAQAEGLPTTSWQSGSVVRTILLVMASMFSMFSKIIIEPIRGGFGDLLSSLGWAKIWSKQMYDVDAVGAAAATGYIDATNAGTSSYPLQAGELIVASSVTGKLYRNSAAITINASSTLSDIAISAVEVGTGSNAAPGDVSVIVGPSLDGVTVTNAQPILGSDDETTAAIVLRSRAKLASLSPNGPKDAYNYVAKTPELAATSTPITRAMTRADPVTGLVTVYVATAGGAPSGADIAICQTAEDKWAEPWCTTATVVAATPVTIAVTYTAVVRSSLAESDIKAAIAVALTSYFADLPIGGEVIAPLTVGYLYVDSLVLVIAGAKVNDTPIGAVRVTVTLPAADTNLNPDKVAVLGTITGTVTYI